MFYQGMVIHCNNQAEWDELMDLLEAEEYRWPSGNRPHTLPFAYDENTQYVLISSSVKKQFFRRGIHNIHNDDVEAYDAPIEYADWIGGRRKITVMLDDLM